MATKLNPEAVIDASITKQKLSSQLQSELTDASEHISNSTIHITAAERTGWNGKADQNGNYPNLHVGVADNLLDKGDTQQNEEIMFRPTAGELSVSNGQAAIEKIKGKTIVWNQLVQNGDFSDGTTGWQRYNSTISVANNELTVTKTSEASAVGGFAQSTSFESNTTHKYYISANLKTGGGETVSFGFHSNHTISGNTIINTINYDYEHVSSIVSPKNVGDTLCIRIGNSQSETGSTGYARSVICIDLTQMFGAGNEPSTVEEFEELFPKNYYDYNPGQLISFNGEEIKTTGFNQLKMVGRTPFSINKNPDNSADYIDEDNILIGFSRDGYIRGSAIASYSVSENGVTVKTSGNDGSQYYGIGFPFRVFPSMQYYLNVISNSGSTTKYITWADSNKHIISYTQVSTSSVTSPSNAVWAIVSFIPGAVSTEASFTECNLNLHHTGIRDGQYEPYTEHTKTLPDLSNFDVTYTGADGQTHIAGGLKSAGSVYDEQTDTKDIRRIGVVDLGTLNYTPYQDRYYSTDLDNSAKESGKTICERYPSIKNEDKNVWLDNGTHGRFYIQDSSYSDAASLKASLAGVLLYYELATPVETEVQSRNMYYSVDDYGTEQLLPENTSVPTTTPMIADIKYGFNAVDLVRTIPDLTGRVEELEEDVVYKGEVIDSDVIDIDATLPARMGNAESDISSIKTRLSNIETEIIFGKHKYCVGYWLENASTATDAELNNPDALGVIGNKDWVLDWRPFLVDMTPKEGEIYKRPVAELKKNNWLRDITGGWAPVVGITQAQWDECMGNDLYFEGNVLYCNSGQYDPEDFWENHCSIQTISGVKTLTHDKLYKSSGTEVSHYLMPYETVEKKYSIFIGKADGEELYLLDGAVGESGREWKGVLGHGIDTWDGIDASRYKLEATGICPSPVTAIKEGSQIKLRSFYYDYPNTDIPQANGVISTLLPSLTLFSGGHYPMVAIGQQTVMGYAWANNYDTNKPYPCAEGGYHARNTFLTCMESGYGTKNLNTATRFSSGVSARDTCNSEATWKANGGVRFKVKTGTNWTYGTWGTTPNLYYDKNGVLTKVSNWSDTINSYRLKCKSLEAQLAVSFATELGITAGEEFDFRGNTWYYQGISELGVTGLSGGQMNCRVYKKLSQVFTALDSTGASKEYEIEVILRTGLMQGCDMSGDGGIYWGGGAEIIGLCSNITQGSDGNIADCYLQPDQKRWVKDSTITKSDGGRFTCEDTYLYLGQAAGGKYDYMRRRVPYSPAPLLYGGSLTSGECAYTYDRNYWGSTLGARVRQGLRFGTYSSNSLLSSRILNSNNAASSASYQFYCGSAQILLDVQRRAAQ